MLGYGILGSCARRWLTPHSTIASATPHNEFIATSFRFIASFEAIDMLSSPLYGLSPPTALTRAGCPRFRLLVPGSWGCLCFPSERFHSHSNTSRCDSKLHVTPCN